MAANTISGLGKPRDRFWGPGRALPEAPEGDSDETVGKNSAGPSKTHETVSKNSDRRLKTYDFAWDCQQKQTSGEPPETQKHRILTRLSIKRRTTIKNRRRKFERQSQQKARCFISSRKTNAKPSISICIWQRLSKTSSLKKGVMWRRSATESLVVVTWGKTQVLKTWCNSLCVFFVVFLAN